jgi:hypothetical protein
MRLRGGGGGLILLVLLPIGQHSLTALLRRCFTGSFKSINQSTFTFFVLFTISICYSWLD